MSEQHDALVDAILNIEDDERRAGLLAALEDELPDVCAEVRRLVERGEVKVRIPIPGAIRLTDPGATVLDPAKPAKDEPIPPYGVHGPGDDPGAWSLGSRVAGHFEI